MARLSLSLSLPQVNKYFFITKFERLKVLHVYVCTRVFLPPPPWLVETQKTSTDESALCYRIALVMERVRVEKTGLLGTVTRVAADRR